MIAACKSWLSANLRYSAIDELSGDQLLFRKYNFFTS